MAARTFFRVASDYFGWRRRKNVRAASPQEDRDSLTSEQCPSDRLDVIQQHKPMHHPFLLVLHFPPESALTSADIEDDIAEAIGSATNDEHADHVVDGNEIGDAIDIFVLTRDPEAALELCKPLLQESQLLDTMVAAYRRVDGGRFGVLYPPGYQGEFRV